MTTAVETGIGSTFKLDNASGTLTLLGEVTGIPIPTGTSELIDASHFGSTDFRDYIQSPLRDGEEADLTINWIPGNATDALLVAARGETRDFEIVLPVGAAGTYTFTGSVLVRDYIRENPLDDKRTGTLRVKWVSAITEVYDDGTP